MPSLYVHIPFCVRKCEYCDFYSEAAGEQDIDRYLAALEREFQLRFADGITPHTVFIGGGTPTRLNARQLRALGAIFSRHVDLSSCAEFTCEINPSTLDPEKAGALAALGVNRASFGVQSFNPSFLHALGRGYEAGTPAAAVACARVAGITRINLDLMFALPGQSVGQLKDDITRAIDLDTEHLSLYALTYEDDTPLTRDLAAGRVAPCPENLECEMFTAAGEVCAAAGLQRYEVSNFARPGAECLHNLVYWRTGDWAGVGAGAHSLLGGEITANAADHRAYAETLEQGRVPTTRRELLEGAQLAETVLLMGLRLREGVSLARMNTLVEENFQTRCAGPLETLTNQGLIEVVDGRLRATEEGLLLLDTVILELACALDSTPARP